MKVYDDAAGAAPDNAFVKWLAEDAAIQRFFSDVTSRGSSLAEGADPALLGELPQAHVPRIPELCQRYGRETRALARDGAPLEGFRSSHMALWAGAGRLMGRIDAERIADPDSAAIAETFGHGLAMVTEEWRAFGDYEVSSLVDVRFEQFRLDRACRYHYWRARLGAFSLEWTDAARPQTVEGLRAGYRQRIELQDSGLAGVFSEWLDEERALREMALELSGAVPPAGGNAGEVSSPEGVGSSPEGVGSSSGHEERGDAAASQDAEGELIAHLVFQEIRWRGIEEELEKRALWHGWQQGAGRGSVLTALRLGEIGSYDPEFRGEDRALLALAKLGRLASFSDTGHRSLADAPGGMPMGAAEA